MEELLVSGHNELFLHSIIFLLGGAHLEINKKNSNNNLAK